MEPIKCGEILFGIDYKLKYACNFCKFNDCNPRKLEEHFYFIHFNNIAQSYRKLNKSFSFDNLNSNEPHEVLEEIETVEIKHEICDEDESVEINDKQKGETKEILSQNLTIINQDDDRIMGKMITDDENNENDDNLDDKIKEPSKSRFKCDHCELQFTYNKVYLRHLSNFKNHQTNCSKCGKPVCGSAQIKRHMIEEHQDYYAYEESDKEKKKKLPTEISTRTKCEYCDQHFETNAQYKTHRQFYRKTQNQCPVCNKKLCGFRQFTSHMKWIHSMPHELPTNFVPVQRKLNEHTSYKAPIHEYHCDICKKVCYVKANIRNHMRTHSGEKPYHCLHCPQRFTQISSFNKHTRLKHTNERTFQCSECGKCFGFLGGLNRHFRETHRKHEQSKVSCSICSQTFNKKWGLKLHMIKHTDERPFQCSQCDKSFKDFKVLQEHEKLHLDTKTYQCPYCPISFAQRAGRRGHIRRVHEGNGAFLK